MIVEGVLEQASVIESGTTFLNYGGRLPDYIFYGVIFGNSETSFYETCRDWREAWLR